MGRGILCPFALYKSYKAFILLRIDLAVLVENVSIDLCNHIYLCMSCIALCGLQIAVVEFQLVSRTGMSQRVKDDVREPCLLFQQ